MRATREIFSSENNCVNIERFLRLRLRKREIAKLSRGKIIGSFISNVRWMYGTGNGCENGYVMTASHLDGINLIWREAQIFEDAVML